MYISGEQRKFLIIVVGGILALALDIFFIIRPLIKNTYNLQVQTVKIKKDADDLNQQISKIDYIKKKLTILNSDYALYGKKFPKEEEVISLLETISTIASSSKVSISALGPTEPGGGKEAVTSEVLREVPISINVKGGYHQIGSFINKLENLDKFIKIKNIEITYDTATPRKHNLKLLVSTYIFLKT